VSCSIAAPAILDLADLFLEPLDATARTADLLIARGGACAVVPKQSGPTGFVERFQCIAGVTQQAILLPLGREPVQLRLDCMEITHQSAELLVGLREQELQILGRHSTLERGDVRIQLGILPRDGILIR